MKPSTSMTSVNFTELPAVEPPFPAYNNNVASPSVKLFGVIMIPPETLSNLKYEVFVSLLYNIAEYSVGLPVRFAALKDR